ncbi:CBS domain-containing protein [Candidatus Micrarchaeota archaeon]|nr:CBS domain-containing protein [Candidatus Micrarchaeota archaeon]
MDSNIIQAPLVMDGNEMLSKAIGQLNKRRDDYFVVADGTAYVGVVDSRVLRDFDGDPSKTKCLTVACNAPVLRQTDSDESVVEKLLATRTKVLPVLDKSDHVVGVVTRWTALGLVKSAPVLHGKKVAEFMSAPAVSVPETTTIAQARALMKAHGVFRLVVLDSKNQVSGVVSSFDIATRAQSDPKDKRRQYYYFSTPKIRADAEPVSSIMTSPAQTLDAAKPVLEAVALLQKHGVSSLVITQDGKLVGVLTSRDVFSACLVPQAANVRFIGLDKEEHIFKASLEALATKYWDKLSTRVDLQPDDDLVVNVKAKAVGGKRRQYEVKARLTVKGKVFAVNPKDRPEHFQNWDLQAAVKEALDELVKIVTSQH